MGADANIQACEFVPHRTLAQAMVASTSGGFAVVPYYNLIEGLIQETLDLLIEHNLTVLAAMQLPVRFAIGGFVPDANINCNANVGSCTNLTWPVASEVPIFSHPKGLAQCSAFLQKNIPASTQHELTSTAQAARQVAESRFGLAIACRETLEQFGLPVLCDDIGNRLYSRCNCTEFLLVGRQDATISMRPKEIVKRQKRTLIAIVPVADRVGLLAEILGQIAFFGINLLKIHSRPAPTDDDGPAPQMFYLETDAPIDSPELRLCFETLEMRLAKQNNTDRVGKYNVVRVLGGYELLLCQSGH